MSRRPLLACLALVVVAGACTPVGDGAPLANPTATPATPSPPADTTTADAADAARGTDPTTEPASPRPSPSPSPALAGPPAIDATWTPADAEVAVAVKQLAADVAVHLTTHDPDELPDTRVATVPTGSSDGPVDEASVTAAATALHRSGAWSRGRVHYPQLGGLTDEAASVMVVTEQRWRDAEAVEDTSAASWVRTIDVRLRRAPDGPWRLEGVASVGGAPVDSEPPSQDAAALLTDDRVSLPDSSRWDILDGSIDPALVTLLRRIGERVPVGAVAVRSGHPVHVFDTDRVSHHTLGRAVDIHTVAGSEVVTQREEGTPAHDLVQWLYEQPEVAGIGSPWALDGFGGRSFTDVVHQDHIHVAVRATDDD